MKELKEKIEKFIVDNELEFNNEGSDLNGNCVILAGFICYVISLEEGTSSDGDEIIAKLDISTDAAEELERVFTYAYINSYEKFWKTPAAKEQYIF